jgi:hypothetical protein
MTERVFDACVHLLDWCGQRLGMTYKQINVLLFCAVLPAVVIGQTIAILWLLCR